MEETSLLDFKEESKNPIDIIGNEKSLLDMDDFGMLDTSAQVVSETNNENIGRDLLGDFTGVSQSGLMSSTTRPLSTSREDIGTDDTNISPLNSAILSELEKPDKKSPIDISDHRADDSYHVSAAELVQRRDGERLSIDEEDEDSQQGDGVYEFLISSSKDERSSPVSFTAVHDTETAGLLPKVKDPKIGSQTEVHSDNYKLKEGAYEPAAQPAEVKREVAMESETVGNASKNSECECPFSAGAWFNPEKLHPVVAQYVYWQDPKKSGVVFGSLLILLLSLKYFSFISVLAYITLALLCVTISYRIYKNVLQAVQKSNEGHPFKEYLEMDITLSQDKVGETVEVLIHHVNCVTSKLRSLVLVEDLVDTIKLLAFAWFLTYIGAWFNGLTLIILALVSAFTLPKVYETNKAQIDVYAEIARTKSKEIIDMVNAKMPMGKKKKDE